MAIVIPSKNIYDKNNPKIRDNVIERIEVSATEVVPNNEYEVTVASRKHKATKKSLIDYGHKNAVNISFPNQTLTTYSASYSSCKLYYYAFDFSIPVLGENKYISNIYDWKKEMSGNEGAPNGVKCSFIGRKKTQSLNATFEFADGGKSGYATNLQYGELVIGNDERIELPEVDGNHIGDIYLDFSVKDETDIRINQYIKDYYDIKGAILIGIDFEYAKGSTSIANLQSPSAIQISGSHEIYEIDEVEFSIFGDTIGINLEDNTLFIPSEDQSSKKVLSISGSELMQTDNTISGTATSSIQEAFSKTKQQYENGKETAVLKCSISDYFDERGTVAISADGKVGITPDRMTFQNGDEVIPMVCGTDGKDRPLSQKNGSPKVFKVLGVKRFYDGAVWQEISLQEI